MDVIKNYLFINLSIYLLLDVITINLFIFSPLEVELLKTFCSTETFLPANKNHRKGRVTKKTKQKK